jgi:hypothetical protein
VAGAVALARGVTEWRYAAGRSDRYKFKGKGWRYEDRSCNVNCWSAAGGVAGSRLRLLAWEILRGVSRVF